MIKSRSIFAIINILLLSFFALLTGCATVSTSQTIATPTPQMTSAWQKQHAQLALLTSWKVQGRIAVTAGNRGGSASLFWQQTNQNYLIELFGPLGAGAVYLQGAPGQIVLTSSRGQRVQAQSPEQLLQQEFGWQIPVTPLFYWVRGIPAPQGYASTQFNPQGQLAQLNQKGWQINYLAYENVNGIELPQQMILREQGIVVRLIIDRWSV